MLREYIRFDLLRFIENLFNLKRMRTIDSKDVIFVGTR